jgi:hypothetical protein
MYSWSEIGEAFRTSGMIDSKAAQRSVAKLAVTWDHPPLIVDKAIEFQGLKVYHAWQWAPEGMDVDDVINVFEEYVDGFIASDMYKPKDTRGFLQRELQIPEERVRFYVPNTNPADNIGMILWVAANMGATLQYDESQVLLSHDGRTVGVQQGKLVSLYPNSCVDFPETNWTKVFEEPRGKGWSRNRAFNWLGRRFRDDLGASLLLQYVRAAAPRVDPFLYQVFGKGEDAVLTPYSRRLIRQQAQRIMTSRKPAHMAIRILQPYASRIQIEDYLGKELKAVEEDDCRFNRLSLAERLLDIQDSLRKNQL